MLDIDAICEPVNPLWNIEQEYMAFIEKHGFKPKNENEMRLIAKAVREERTGEELHELKARLRDPEKYREKCRKHEQRRKERRNKMRYG